jgi:hypothetical protein
MSRIRLSVLHQIYDKIFAGDEYFSMIYDRLYEYCSTTFHEVIDKTPCCMPVASFRLPFCDKLKTTEGRKTGQVEGRPVIPEMCIPFRKGELDYENIERWDPSVRDLPYLTKWFERGRIRIPDLHKITLDPDKITHVDFNPDNWSNGHIGNVRNKEDKNRRFDAAANGDKDGILHYSETNIIQEHRRYISTSERFIPAQFVHDVVHTLRSHCNNPDSETPLMEKGTDYADVKDQFVFRRVSESGTMRLNRWAWIERPDVPAVFVDNLRKSLMLPSELRAHAKLSESKVQLGTDLNDAKAFVIKEFLNVAPPKDRATGEWEMFTEHPHLPNVFWIRHARCPYFDTHKEWCSGYPKNKDCHLWKPKWREGTKHPACCVGCWDHWLYGADGSEPTIPELQELVYRIICQRQPNVNPNPVPIPHDLMPQSILNIRGESIFPNPEGMWKVQINGTPEQKDALLKLLEKLLDGKVLALPEHKVPMPQCQAEILTARDRLREQRCPPMVRALLEKWMGELKDHEELKKKIPNFVIR